MFYDITIKEDEDSSSDTDVSTSTDAYIDYDKLGDVIYKNTYNALVDYEKENTINSKNIKNFENTAVNDVTVSDAPLVFASSTDATLYTVQTVDAPSTLAEQVGAYTLDTRNILLIFLLIYLVITLYSKLKNTLIKFYGG